MAEAEARDRISSQSIRTESRPRVAWTRVKSNTSLFCGLDVAAFGQMQETRKFGEAVAEVSFGETQVNAHV